LIRFQRHRTAAPPRNTWVQITDFSDSAVSPALSPDGHMIAFIRGPDTFITSGQSYVKFLPNGQPVQLTHDNRLKMAPAFSPDGSRIAYTTTDPNYGWNSWVVPVLGGEPQKLLPNAAALTWVDRQQVMFSEDKGASIRGGAIMSVATATESRAGERDVYFPNSTGGMAHRSWISPDGKWVLIAEMDYLGWLPCRVLPFDGSNTGEVVGPKKARCTYAGWSPDGKTMYFSANAGDGYHVWRQHFPKGVSEQLTFGPTEEEGIAVSPDGGMLVTSAGIRQSTVWLHDAKGDRQISGEGFAIVPGLGFAGGGNRSVFSPDRKRLFYLVHKEGSRAYKAGELWAVDLDSGANEAVLPGVLMSEFQLSPNGDQVAFVAQDAKEMSHVWIAALDRRAPPKQITSSASNGMTFGPGGDIYFIAQEASMEFLYRRGSGETTPRRISPQPVENFVGLSPHGDWLLSGNDPVIARPPQGGPAIRVCNFCGIGWGPDGKLLYMRFRDMGEMGGGKEGFECGWGDRHGREDDVCYRPRSIRLCLQPRDSAEEHLQDSARMTNREEL
jgi:eukaryotic-like serine/threonine-protein kinase